MATSSVGPTPRWKLPPSTRPAVAIAPTRLAASTTAAGRVQQADDEEDAADELEHADEVGRDLRPAGMP